MQLLEENRYAASRFFIKWLRIEIDDNLLGGESYIRMSSSIKWHIHQIPWQMEEVFLHMAVCCCWISNHGKCVPNIIHSFKHAAKIYARQVPAKTARKYFDLQLTKHAHVACGIWINASSGIIFHFFVSL